MFLKPGFHVIKAQGLTQDILFQYLFSFNLFVLTLLTFCQNMKQIFVFTCVYIHITQMCNQNYQLLSFACLSDNLEFLKIKVHMEEHFFKIMHPKCLRTNHSLSSFWYGNLLVQYNVGEEKTFLYPQVSFGWFNNQVDIDKRQSVKRK